MESLEQRIYIKVFGELKTGETNYKFRCALIDAVIEMNTQYQTHDIFIEFCANEIKIFLRNHAVNNTIWS